MDEWWRYENLESGFPYNWNPSNKGNHSDDNLDFHIDLGAGKLKKGRLTIDRHGDVDILCNLNNMTYGGCKYKGEHKPHPMPADEAEFKNQLCFPDNSIESIISHHCLEHIGDGFIRLMDECYRVLVPGGKFRIIVPLFPSIAAVEDPDHKRYFTKDTFETFCGADDGSHWHESFSVPYTKSRFKMTEHDCTPAPSFPKRQFFQSDGTEIVEDFTIDDLFAEPREMRVTLQK